MKEIKLFVLFSGNGSNLENLYHTLHNQTLQTPKEEVQIKFIGALSNNAKAYGIKRCQSLELPCQILPHQSYPNRQSYDEALIKHITPHSPDFVILSGFMRILTSSFVNAFRCINIHPSYLPNHKGAYAIKDSFEDLNFNYGGVSVHYVNEELDGGKIILQEKLDKTPYPTLEKFEAAIHQLEYSLYPQAIKQAIKEMQ